jgi:hypothetical protein
MFLILIYLIWHLILEGKGFKILSIAMFVDHISQHIKSGTHNDLVIRFILHQSWLDWLEKQDMTSINILQERTQCVLDQLDFRWYQLTNNMLHGYFDSLEVG